MTQPWLSEGKLGFGLMRLPRKRTRINLDEFASMVDEFLAAGLTYFDTAHIYPGSEEATRKALVERYPRQSFHLATKLYPVFSPTAAMAKNQLATSLKRLGTDYIDAYLLHSIMDATYKRYDRLGLWDFAAEQKAAGVLRRVGFSFHGGPEVLEKLLTAHPEVDFVQLQINYADWESARVQSRANYEVARAHDVPIIVMEPVKGGELIKLPRDVQALFDAENPDASYASWAIRYAASLEGVACVLSGMSNLEQMRDNLSYMRSFEPLTDRERSVIRQAQQLLGASSHIACTSCGYCTKGCPTGIPIPEIFHAMNDHMDGRLTEADDAYHAATTSTTRAGDCIGCAACEKVCTQGLPIVQLLEECATTFDRA